MTADARLSRRALLGLGLRGQAEPEPDDPGEATRSGPAEAWRLGAPLLDGAVGPVLAAAGVDPGHEVLHVGPADGAAAEALGAGAVSVSADETSALRFAARSFDRALSLFDVTYATEPRRAMAELERVLRPGGVIAVAAWASAGLMGRLLRLASGGRGARPERWGRYEGAQLLFSRFPDFELREHTLRWTFDDLEAAADAVAAPPALAEAVETELRGHGRAEHGAFVVDIAYVVIAARKPAWA